jgi:thiamine biosynthesis lipoprotein
LLAACRAGDDRLHEERLLAMGTWVDITLDAPDAANRNRLIGEIEALLRGFERDYYAWADGELARLNRAVAHDQPLRVSRELAALLTAAQRIADRSGGAFEPAVGDLVEMWGFHSAASGVGEPPDPASIARWLRRAPSIRNLSIDAAGMVRPSAGGAVMLDLGGIAKGEAVDRIVQLLSQNGVANALVNAGGDLRVLGSRAGRPWRIGIRAPRDDGLLGVLELADGEAAFTSGDYERFYEYAGQRMHHILDPATGYPVAHTQAVTVVTTGGVTADAAATALLVAGPVRWRAIADALGVTMVLRVDASGRIELTPQMRERLQAGAAAGSDIILKGH